MNNDFLQQLQQRPLEAVANFYAASLQENPHAVEFVREELRLTIAQATEKRIGFSDRSLGNQIPGRRVKAGRQVRDLLVSIGIYKANGRETMRGRVCEPVVDQAGNVVGLRGHKVDRHADGEAVVVVGDDNAQQETLQKEEANASETNCTNQETSSLITQGSSLVFTREDRRYRIRGLEKNRSTCTLKVNLMASRDDLVHLDSLDLVKAGARASFIKATATELYVDHDIIKKDIGLLLWELETLQSERIDQLKTPTQVEVKLTGAERSEAMEFLKDPNLLERIVADMEACGYVGEPTNKLAGYLAATSRKLSQPLAVVIQSSSSAGKTSLMDAVLSMMPEEDQMRISKLTGQSLYYLETSDIQHKVLAISEDEGIREATYALKLLQSEGCLRHASVGKGENGKMATQQRVVEGPTQIFLTTTAIDLDEELMNRCLVLTVDESRNQTGAIQLRQRNARTLQAKMAAATTNRLRRLHHNAQRCLRPVEVNNPYAPQLTFADNLTRLRRDHQKYLTLIDTIALLHQHGRKVHHYQHEGKTVQYINVEPSDIAIANGMAGEILGRSLDELSPQTRNLLMQVHQFVGDLAKDQGLSHKAIRFTRRDLRESIGWSDFQIHTHLSRLVELEYVIAHRGRQGRRFVYELLYDGKGREGQPFLCGLIDPAKLLQPAPTTGSLSA